MEKNYHLYIITYDIDSSSDPKKSKGLIEFLRKYHAVCLTKSTWLLCTLSDCQDVFCAASSAMDGGDVFSLFDFVTPRGYNDRLFVAEITGEVYHENLICDEPGSPLSLGKLLQLSGSESVKEG